METTFNKPFYDSRKQSYNTCYRLHTTESVSTQQQRQLDSILFNIILELRNTDNFESLLLGSTTISQPQHHRAKDTMELSIVLLSLLYSLKTLKI